MEFSLSKYGHYFHQKKKYDHYYIKLFPLANQPLFGLHCSVKYKFLHETSFVSSSFNCRGQASSFYNYKGKFRHSINKVPRQSFSNTTTKELCEPISEMSLRIYIFFVGCSVISLSYYLSFFFFYSIYRSTVQFLQL